MKFKFVTETNKEVFILGPIFVKDFYSNGVDFRWSIGISFGFFVIGLGVEKDKLK